MLLHKKEHDAMKQQEGGKIKMIQLNDNLDEDVYKVFPGPNLFYWSDGRSKCGALTEQLPLLLGEGRILMPGKTLMERRLGASEGTKSAWRDNYFTIALFNIRDPTSDEVKAVLANEHPGLLARITPGAGIQSGPYACGLPLTQEEYLNMQGFSFNQEDLIMSPHSSCHCASSSKKQAFWEFVAEGDTTLAKDYREMVNQIYGRSEERIMDVVPSSDQGLRFWSVGEANLTGSLTVGDTNLKGYISRLVGIIPKN